MHAHLHTSSGVNNRCGVQQASKNGTNMASSKIQEQIREHELIFNSAGRPLSLHSRLREQGLKGMRIELLADCTTKSLKSN